jgi:ubiquinone/menaquinone biosynthesis C-methylase UbiE
MSEEKQYPPEETASVTQQYEDGAYSKFVRSAENSLLYTAYIHHGFMFMITHFLKTGKSQKRVLDVGCGDAVLGRKIKRTFPNTYVLGIDASSAMIAEASQRITEDGVGENFDLINCHVSEIPYEVGSFDVAISGFVLAHMATRSQLFDFFRKVSAHLKPGGVTIHIIPVVEDFVAEGRAKKVALPYEEDGETKSVELFDFHWTERTYRNACTTAGLVDVSIQPGVIAPQSGLKEPLSIHINLLFARKH